MVEGLLVYNYGRFWLVVEHMSIAINPNFLKVVNAFKYNVIRVDVETIMYPSVKG